MAVKTYGRRSHDCRCASRSAVSICLAVPLIVGFLVSLGICVYHVYEANEDRRSELVAAYDSSVEAWTAGDAETYAEKWTGEAALPLPSLTVDRDDPNHVDGTFTFGVFQSGDEALGALRDAEPDYLRYDQGTVLQTTIETSSTIPVGSAWKTCVSSSATRRCAPRRSCVASTSTATEPKAPTTPTRGPRAKRARRGTTPASRFYSR